MAEVLDAGLRRLTAGLAVASLTAACASTGSRPPRRASTPSAAHTSQAQLGPATARMPTAYSGHVQLTRGHESRLLNIPGVAEFSAYCTDRRRAQVSFVIRHVSANVTIASGARIVGHPNPKLGHSVTVPFQTSPAEAATVQIAQFAEVAKVADVDIAAGPQPGTVFSCEVSAQAVVSTAQPQRSSG